MFPYILTDDKKKIENITFWKVGVYFNMYKGQSVSTE